MTKIDIISGFLGAGKTTFIKKMIEEVFKGEKIVLIENEFGEVGIDGGFLKDAGIDADIVEDGKTFEENAQIKAKTICDLTGEILSLIHISEPTRH